MGFATAYLLKAGLRELPFPSDPHPGLNLILTIPVYNESGLERCLDSLLIAAGPSGNMSPDGETENNDQVQEEDEGEGIQLEDEEIRSEVLILINASSGAPEAVLEQNLATFSAARTWIAHHPHPSIRFHVWLDHSFGQKEAGVGLARKILMDEAVRRFDAVGKPRGIIASLDADVIVDANYLEALSAHFNGSDAEGCSIYFEHPLEPEPAFEAFSPEVYAAITQYELHLRYYLSSLRSTGFPHAYHTVGSSFAVRAEVYCLEGGMNKRQGGEDFYFIQKIAQRSRWSECNTTRVLASPRPSDRVPFGTGPVVSRLSADAKSADQQALDTYHPEPFQMLAGLFGEIDRLYQEEPARDVYGGLPGVLSDFLETQDFVGALTEIRGNSGSPDAFRKRFWRWFNMFRMMKFLHHAREHGYPDIPILEASYQLLSKELKSKNNLSDGHSSPTDLLIYFRSIDRNI